MIRVRKAFRRYVLLQCLAAGLSTWGALAQDVNDLSRGIGQIERGFWTRPIQNEMSISDGNLIIARTTRTTVEWVDEGIQGRSVTDTLRWVLALDEIAKVTLSSVPGATLLEGSDQDSYCPLTEAKFSCMAGATACDDQAAFFTCRYNTPELEKTLTALQKRAPGMTISHSNN